MAKRKYFVFVLLAVLVLLLVVRTELTAPSSFSSEDLCDWLQQEIERNDFTPQTNADGWTYFYVADMRSIYRINSDLSTPELVLEDCDGNVQVSGDTMYFLRKGDSRLHGNGLPQTWTARVSGFCPHGCKPTRRAGNALWSEIIS